MRIGDDTSPRLLDSNLLSHAFYPVFPFYRLAPSVLRLVPDLILDLFGSGLIILFLVSTATTISV